MKFYQKIIDNSKKHTALPTVRYSAHGRRIYKEKLRRIQKKKPVGKPSKKDDVPDILCNL